MTGQLWPIQFRHRDIGYEGVNPPLVPLAHQAFEVMLIAYQNGKTDFTTLISTFRQLSDARTAYLQAVNQLLAGKVALEQAAGGNLP